MLDEIIRPRDKLISYIHLYRFQYKHSNVVLTIRGKKTTLNTTTSLGEEKRRRNIPESNSKDLFVRLQFCERFSSVKEGRSLIFFTPASVKPPPHISRDWRFLKPVSHEKRSCKIIEHAKLGHIKQNCWEKFTIKLRFHLTRFRFIYSSHNNTVIGDIHLNLSTKGPYISQKLPLNFPKYVQIISNLQEAMRIKNKQPNKKNKFPK